MVDKSHSPRAATGVLICFIWTSTWILYPWFVLEFLTTSLKGVSFSSLWYFMDTTVMCYEILKSTAIKWNKNNTLVVILWKRVQYFILFFFLVRPLYCYQPISLHPCEHMLSRITPWTATCQAPLSMDFSRQEYWSGLPFPSPKSPIF